MPIQTLLFRIFFLLITTVSFSQSNSLIDHVLFYSSFDGTTTADIAVGDSLIYCDWTVEYFQYEML
jgi:hypothetical protein